jgi:hypothetical protein
MGRNKTAERDAIKRVVQEGEIMVVWITEKGMIEWCPTAQGECALFGVKPSRPGFVASGADVIRNCTDLMLKVGLPTLIIHGITGLGATDVGREKWGGDDKMTYDDLWGPRMWQELGAEK